MDFKDISKQLISTILNYNSMLIYIKGSPDPDAIASSYALKVISNMNGVKSNIIASMEPSLPQNNAIINDLDIPIRFENPIRGISSYDSYSILDHQSAIVKDLSDIIPCAIHIDHHEPVKEDIAVDFKFVMKDVGSVSTIFALVIKELENEIKKSLLVKVATALLYGIKTDTDNYRHASYFDYKALDYLLKYFDKGIIDNITGIPLTKQTLGLLGEAIKNQVRYKDWLLTGIGFIDESYRDSIALIADFLVQRGEYSTVVVFALIEGKSKKTLKLDASFRTDDKNIDLNEVIKQISSEGGARKFKGAYQLDLDYFFICPNKALLWDVISITTIEALKRQKDAIRFIELKNYFKDFKDRVLKLLKRSGSYKKARVLEEQ